MVVWMMPALNSAGLGEELQQPLIRHQLPRRGFTRGLVFMARSGTILLRLQEAVVSQLSFNPAINTAPHSDL